MPVAKVRVAREGQAVVSKRVHGTGSRFARASWRRGAVVVAVLAVGAACAVAEPAAAAVDASLTRYPYLTDSIQDSITVNWATAQAGTTGRVEWGPVGSCNAHTVDGTTSTTIRLGDPPNQVVEYQWKADLPVAPDTAYCYRVFLDGTDLLGSDPSPQFTSQVAKGSTAPYSFAVFGDWGQAHAMAPGDPNANPDQASVLSQIAGSGARFAVMTGDTAYANGNQLNYGDLYQTGDQVSGVFGPSFWGVPGRSIPVFNVTGNHGFSNNPNPQIENWPEMNAAATSGGRYTMEDYTATDAQGTVTAKKFPSFWYGFDAGPARFYILTTAWSDSQKGLSGVYAEDAAAHWAPGEAEYEWLKRDLEAHPRGLKFAFWHYPLYADTSGTTSDTYLQGGPGKLQGLLDANNVNIVFNGHAHGYERNVPDRAGMYSYVFGNGGADLGPVGDPNGTTCSAFDAYAIGYDSGRSVGSSCGQAPPNPSKQHVFGFAKVTVNGQRVTVAPTDSLGNSFDVQTYLFASSEPDSQAPSVPSGVTATATASDRVELSWNPSTDNVGITGYRVYRDDTLIATLDGTTTTYTDATVSPGITYRYQVAATDAAGNQSANSPTESVRTPGPPDTQAPSAPGNLMATASSIHVQLTWTASTDNVGVAGYRIYHDGSFLGSASAGATSYDDETASPAISCTYSVSAVDAADNESSRTTVTICMQPSTAGKPSTGSIRPAPVIQPPTVPHGACSVRLNGRARADLLLGTSAGERILGRGGNDRLEGFGGADCLYGSAGRDTLLGGSGNDRLYGGTGNDRVGGGTGNDRLSGGMGHDRLLGDGGRDTIEARDGRRDVVDCGSGRDTARVDRYDRVRRCEKVTRTR
jgi:chitodextrinase